jgi:hypothetical protein
VLISTFGGPLGFAGALTGMLALLAVALLVVARRRAAAIEAFKLADGMLVTNALRRRKIIPGGGLRGRDEDESVWEAVRRLLTGGARGGDAGGASGGDFSQESTGFGVSSFAGSGSRGG